MLYDRSCTSCAYFITIFDHEKHKCYDYCAKDEEQVNSDCHCDEFISTKKVQSRYANNMAKLRYMQSIGTDIPDNKDYRKLVFLINADAFILNSGRNFQERFRNA